jgi:type IV pilus assembly protein PilV
MMTISATRKSQKGVMLLEALISILIFSMGILALIGLQARAIASVSDANYRSQASFLADQIIGQMWVDRTNLADYSLPAGSAAALTPWLAQVNDKLPGTQANPPQITVNAATGQVTVTVLWQPPNASAPHSQTAVTQIVNP